MRGTMCRKKIVAVVMLAGAFVLGIATGAGRTTSASTTMPNGMDVDDGCPETSLSGNPTGCRDHAQITIPAGYVADMLESCIGSPEPTYKLIAEVQFCPSPNSGIPQTATLVWPGGSASTNASGVAESPCFGLDEWPETWMVNGSVPLSAIAQVNWRIVCCACGPAPVCKSGGTLEEDVFEDPEHKFFGYAADGDCPTCVTNWHAPKGSPFGDPATFEDEIERLDCAAHEDIAVMYTAMLCDLSIDVPELTFFRSNGTAELVPMEAHCGGQLPCDYFSATRLFDDDPQSPPPSTAFIPFRARILTQGVHIVNVSASYACFFQDPREGVALASDRALTTAARLH